MTAELRGGKWEWGKWGGSPRHSEKLELRNLAIDGPTFGTNNVDGGFRGTPRASWKLCLFALPELKTIKILSVLMP